MDLQDNHNVCFKHKSSKIIHYCHHYIWHYNSIITSRLLLEQITVEKQLEIGVGIDQMEDKECNNKHPSLSPCLWCSCYSIFTFSVVICIPLFVRLLSIIVLFLVLLLFTTSDYPFVSSNLSENMVYNWYNLPPMKVYSIHFFWTNLTISSFISSFTFT